MGRDLFRAGWPIVLALLAAATLLGACDNEARAVVAPQTATATSTSTAAPKATATATIASRLTDDQLELLLRRALCWYNDPANLAATCLPPNAETFAAIDALGASGDMRLVAPLVDLAALDVGWYAQIDAALTRLTGARNVSARAWREWLTSNLPPEAAKGYPAWKAKLLALTANADTTPRYDELLTDRLGRALGLLTWTGVQPNASRPLVDPKHVAGRVQGFLANDELVYGIVWNEQARAYPARVVAWHGAVNDLLGGGAVLISHCLPCGSAVAFDRNVGGRVREFGTSGLALQSRTLLFDSGEKRLWDAFTGEAVGEPRGALTPITVFATTWADWYSRHPDTTVMTLETGVVRNYAAGAATADEAATPGPLYPLAPLDPRLAPKEQVVGVQAGGAARAWTVAEVQGRKIIQERVGTQDVVVISEGPGKAIGVYKADGFQFKDVRGSGIDFVVLDQHGERWDMREGALVNQPVRTVREAIPWRQGYWLAWSSAYPTTTVFGKD